MEIRNIQTFCTEFVSGTESSIVSYSSLLLLVFIYFLEADLYKSAPAPDIVS